MRVEPIGWQLRYGRTVGWSFAAAGAGAPGAQRSASSERALFCVTALDASPNDLGMKTELLELTPYGVMEQVS